jgi:hypothetical protein
MFMRNLMRLGAVALAVALLAAVPVTASDMTVGQFVQQLARAKNLNASDPGVAKDALAGAGVLLPSNLDFAAPLTEGDVAKIARVAGLNVRTANPTATFDSGKADRFFSSFSGELRNGDKTYRSRQQRKREEPDGESESDLEDDGSGKGKGKGKGERTPTEPD